jgi:serine/threonine-protein kinase
MTDPQTLAGGRYLLVQRLGEGGMATVWRAFDQRLQVWRAIKILLPEYARKQKIMARFESEAQTMALLEHPHIVRVYDVDHDGEHAYIVMELVEGGSLVDWLERNGPMPPRMAVQVLVEVAQALQFAHDKGVVHRDIKPHNIMVDRDGVCRLTDFGIARAGDSDVNLTKTGAVMGTWGYMAPEQRADAKHVDARADVYALAATLYSLLTDKTPLDLFAAGADASMLEGVPEPLVPVLVRATEYRKELRHGSADELAAALLAVREALPEDPPATPSLRRDLEPLPPPPPKPERTTSELRKPSSETILPDEGSAFVSGSFTRPPSETDGDAELSGQHRAVYEPTPAPRKGRGAVVGVIALVAAAAIGGALWARGPAPEPVVAPTPTVPAEVATPEEPAPAPAATPSGAAPTTTPAPAPTTIASARPTVARPTPAPAPTEPTTTPEPAPSAPVEAPPAVVEPTPAPAPPPKKEQCIEDVVTTPSANAMLGFRAKTCLGRDAPATLHYRPAGGDGWFQKSMAFVSGAWSASLKLDGELAGGVDWYVQSDGVTFGSASRPKTTKLAGAE